VIDDTDYQLVEESKPQTDGENVELDSDDSSNLGSNEDSDTTNDSLSEAEALMPDEKTDGEAMTKSGRCE
jgi:hypothetical protein